MNQPLSSSHITIRVEDVFSLGAGSDPASNQFNMDAGLASQATETVRKSGKRFLGIAHTHGPKVANREPSVTDKRTARKYPVSMLLKVNSNGGGRFEFFTGDQRNIPFTVIGMDGKHYHSTTTSPSFPPTCWARPYSEAIAA